MTSATETKEIVREKYSQIAHQSRETNAASCCGATGCCSTVDYEVFAQDYSNLPGYVKDADLGLGCGIPTSFALIREGSTVVDLGSGAGNDAFVARALCGESGKVIGVDFSPAMLAKAEENRAKLGFSNVQFRQGDIEDIPISNNRADVVISNCVLNLVPDKAQAFREIFRILKPGGHFCVSDVVILGEMPAEFQNKMELYVGCVSGAVQRDEYLRVIAEAGFSDVKILEERRIELPDEILAEYMDSAVIESFRKGDSAVLSITVSGAKADGACCSPDSKCC